MIKKETKRFKTRVLLENLEMNSLINILSDTYSDDSYTEIPLMDILSSRYCDNCVERYTCPKRCDFYKREYNKEYCERLYHLNKSSRSRFINEKIKLGRDCRNKNLDPDSKTGFGYTNEILVAKFLGIKTCFDITGNFNYPKYDLLEHDDWGLINAKGSKLYENGHHQFTTNKNIKPDFFFCIGYDEYRRHVLKVYIVPNDDHISKLHALPILMNGSKYRWFEEDSKPWDDIFHTLKLENCPVLRPRKMRKINMGDIIIE